MLYRSACVCLFALSLAAQTGGSDLNEGVAAFKTANYAEAVSLFEAAVKLEPNNVDARLYLATAYMVQWIPGAASEQNAALAAHAAAEFEAVLAIDPINRTAIASLASLSFNQGKAVAADREGRPERNRLFAESKAWYQKLLTVDPHDKVAFYSLGVIAWEKFHPELMQARALVGMRPQDRGPLTDAKLRADLRTRFGATVEEGVRNLNEAIAIDPRYDDAMAYLNLLLREQADLAESTGDYDRDIAMADSLVARALAARQNNVQQVIGAVPSSAPQTPERVRVGGGVQAQNLLSNPEPVYPPLAQQARIQGVVRFRIIIGKEGRVENVQLISGHPLLVPAAVEAVKQYVYKPTLLNGQPIEVITQVDVKFALPN